MGFSYGFNQAEQEKDYKSARELTIMLADLVSRGGNLLLNVGPKADGTIPGVMKDRLLEIGRWLKANGEAIFGTTRWRATHEGPTTVAMEGTREREEEGFEARFTPRDIWYTSKGKTVYAIALVPPVDRRVVLTALAEDAPEKVKEVRLLGVDEPAKWSRDASGLTVTLPEGCQRSSKPSRVLRPLYMSRASPVAGSTLAGRRSCGSENSTRTSSGSSVCRTMTRRPRSSPRTKLQAATPSGPVGVEKGSNDRSPWNSRARSLRGAIDGVAPVGARKSTTAKPFTEYLAAKESDSSGGSG